MAFSATGLAKEDVVSKSDPFLAALKRRPAGGEADWVPVFKTEVRQGGSVCHTVCACLLWMYEQINTVLMMLMLQELWCSLQHRNQSLLCRRPSLRRSA